MSGRYWVYMLASGRNGTLYIGSTGDIIRRVGEHKAAIIQGFTRRYGVTLLVWFEEYASILDARAQEARMKRWRRAWKIELVETNNPDWRDLALDHIQ